MLKRLALQSLVLVFASAALNAQASGIEGPISGLVYDQFTKEIRPIVGVPGSAYLGTAVASRLDFASVSPDGKLALGIKQGALYLVGLAGEQPEWRSLDPVSGSVDKIVWNADSTAAVVSGQSVTLWRDLKAEPNRLNLLSAGGSEWSAFLLEPGAEDALAARDGGVYRLSSSDAPRLVVAVPSPSSLALSASSDVVFVVDRVNRQILAVRDWNDSPQVSLVANATLGVDDPVAVAVAEDGRSLLVADASRALILLDPGSNSISSRWDLDFQPTQVEHLSSGLYLLNSRTAEAQPLQVLASGSQPAVFFVPVKNAEANPVRRSVAEVPGRGSATTRPQGGRR